MPDNIITVQGDLVKNLLDNLPVGYSADQVKTPNAPFDTPKNTKWLRTTTNLVPTSNVQAGGGWKRTFGVFTVDIFYPRDKGELSALGDFNQIKSIYENQQIGGAKCLECSPVLNGVNGSWYNVQADINFYYEGA